MKQYSAFVFEKYEFNTSTGVLVLNYSYDSELFFTETYTFPQAVLSSSAQKAFDDALFALFIMAGIGYYKACLPGTIVIKQGSLTADQATFFNDIYLNGLSQFLYENDLPIERLAKFPVDEALSTLPPVGIEDLTGTLVAFGGGKDSLTSIGILRDASIALDTFSVGGGPALEAMASTLGYAHWSVARSFDKSIIALNSAGAYNGHVPITGIISFVSVLLALLLNKKSIVFSNDSSTEEGSLTHQGLVVNHQFSKTLYFERAFQDYIRTYVNPSIEYYSLLRPLSLLRISELFIKKFFAQYKDTFSSCNTNFKLENSKTVPVWCGHCTKCAFTFLMFAPFLPKASLLHLFGETNLFEDESLSPTYRRLLGLEGYKPMDCVGTVAENRKAVHLALSTGQFNELLRFESPDSDIDYKAFGAHAMSEVQTSYVQDFLKRNEF